MYGALVLFRAPDMASAATIYSAIFDWSEASLALGSQLKISVNEWRICWLSVIGLLSFEALQELKPKLEVTFFEGVGLKRWVTTWTLVMAILLLGSYGVFVLDKQFIYFQF
jgi:hypothetical protein